MTWPGLATRCDFQSVGWRAIGEALVGEGYHVAKVDPTAGPYRFGVDEHVRSVLAKAGWRDVAIDPVELRAVTTVAPAPRRARAVDIALGMAALQSFLAAYDDRAGELAARALLDAFGAHHDGTGVRLDASVIVITAST